MEGYTQSLEFGCRGVKCGANEFVTQVLKLV